MGKWVGGWDSREGRRAERGSVVLGNQNKIIIVIIILLKVK